ncbi:MAG: hypothetical protein DME32_17645, partial [Verrucomicrobia bacterium]
RSQQPTQANTPFDSLLAQHLTGCRAGLTIYVAASRHAPSFDFTKANTALSWKATACVGPARYRRRLNKPKNRRV